MSKGPAPARSNTWTKGTSTTSSSVTPWPIAGTQPSRLSVSDITCSEPASHRRGDGISEAAPGGEGVVHGRGLVAAVDHTVTALFVAALLAVAFPPRGLQQLLEGRRVPLLEEVAGTLPAEDVVGRVPPRCALEVARAHEELEEEGRLVELPAALRIRQDAREQLVGPLPTEEMLLVGRLRVTVPRRDHHALDAKVHHRVEELARAERVGALEQRRVGRDSEAPPERLPDCFHRVVVDALAADRLVVLRAEPVHVNAEREVLRGLEDARRQPLLEEERVGAEIDVLLPRDQLAHEPPDLGIHQGLAARDRDDRRPALVHRPQALLDREVLLEDLRRILDLAAARAREVAAEEGLEHEDQRVARTAREPLPDHVARHRPHLRERHTHARCTPGRSEPRVFSCVWRVSRIVAAIMAWSSPPRASSPHSPIHAVTAKLNPSTT